MSDYIFYFTEEEKRDIQETWGSRAIACYEELEACRSLIVDLIIENQGLRLNQDLSIEFLIWYETSGVQNRKLKYGLPATGNNFDINKLGKELFELFLRERKV